MSKDNDLTPAAGGRWYRQDDGELVRAASHNPVPSAQPAPAAPVPTKKQPADPKE